MVLYIGIRCACLVYILDTLAWPVLYKVDTVRNVTRSQITKEQEVSKGRDSE